MIKCISKIKARPLHDKLFRTLCRDNEKDFERLLLHTEVRWLSKGACMSRFYFLYDSVIELLSVIDCQLAEAVKPLKNDIAYLTDIFTFKNEVNKKLQGEMITLIRCKSVITAIISKLALYQENIRRNVLSQFPNLCESSVTEDERLKYCLHLRNLEEDMHICFADLLSLNVPHWVIQAFSTDPADLKVELQNQFIESQNDDASKMNFKEDRYDVF